MDDRNGDDRMMQGLIGRALDRRTFILAGLTVVAAGCTSTRHTSQLPGIPWPSDPAPGSSPPMHPPVADHTGDARVEESELPARAGNRESGFAGVLRRTSWTAGRPDFSDMNRMGRPRYITVHHDGMNAFFGTSHAQVADRLERIRRAHRGRGWADIGYHFVVDRAGNVWEARPLAWQGAHVKNHNQNNIGVMALGNFEEQTPSDAQVRAVAQHVRRIMEGYQINARSVRTHLEWAPTACPGRTMQPRIVALRERSFLV